MPRPYQRALWDYLENGGRHAVAVWHRRAGKDEIAIHRTCVAAHERIGNYWHMLPQYNQARKAMWDAINPHSGKKRIDEAFPLELRKSTHQQEMKIEFKSGSMWQLVGSDNFNALMGSPPIGIVYSEWALSDPRAHGYLRPILMENQGWAAFIFTSRGYNHGFNTYQAALKTPGAFAQKLTASQTSVFTPEALKVELQAYIDEYGQHDGDALFRQEYDCDFSAANIGAILGRYVETADKEGRISTVVEYDPDGADIEISSDLGRRHTSAFWFWQPRWDGYALIDYDEDSGLDAEEWAERLKEKIGDRKLKMVWLPHDAKAKTFSAKHSAVETFIEKFGFSKVGIVPRSDLKSHSINAGRIVMKSCYFNRDTCSEGLNSLRSWSFKFDEERKQFSKEPQDDWACDGADAFCEGAKIMSQRELPKPPSEPFRGLTVGVPSVTLNEMWKTVPKPSQRI